MNALQKTSKPKRGIHLVKLVQLLKAVTGRLVMLLLDETVLFKVLQVINLIFKLPIFLKLKIYLIYLG